MEQFQRNAQVLILLTKPHVTFMIKYLQGLGSSVASELTIGKTRAWSVALKNRQDPFDCLSQGIVYYRVILVGEKAERSKEEHLLWPCNLLSLISGFPVMMSVNAKKVWDTSLKSLETKLHILSINSNVESAMVSSTQEELKSISVTSLLEEKKFQFLVKKQMSM